MSRLWYSTEEVEELEQQGQPVRSWSEELKELAFACFLIVAGLGFAILLSLLLLPE